MQALRTLLFLFHGEFLNINPKIPKLSPAQLRSHITSRSGQPILFSKILHCHLNSPSQPILLPHHQPVPRQIHFKKMRNANRAAIHFFMAVQRHQQFAIQRAEQHTMPVIGWRDGIFLLYPWTIQLAACRVGNTLCVHIINPARPYHTEALGGGAKQVRTIGYFIRLVVAVIIFLPAPGCIAGPEQNFSFTDAAT